MQMVLETKPILSKTARGFFLTRKRYKTRRNAVGRKTARYKITILTPSNRVFKYQLRKSDGHIVDKVEIGF